MSDDAWDNRPTTITSTWESGPKLERLVRADYWQSALAASLRDVFGRGLISFGTNWNLAALINERLAERGVVLAVDADQRDEWRTRLDPTICAVCGELADGEPGRCHRHFRQSGVTEKFTTTDTALRATLHTETSGEPR